jgi:hypothetical protein
MPGKKTQCEICRRKVEDCCDLDPDKILICAHCLVKASEKNLNLRAALDSTRRTLMELANGVPHGNYDRKIVCIRYAEMSESGFGVRIHASAVLPEENVSGIIWPLAN